nr:putative reverse transcriptase domain-containing protein [Tanacetum cinerariifolium]
MSFITTQQAKLNLELVPKEKRLEIRKCNGRINPRNIQREPTFQVVLDALDLTPCYFVFLITTDVPKVYMHQFWDSVYKHDTFYRFKMDKRKRIKLNLEIFKDIFKICPRVPGQDFDALPADEEIVSFLRDLGHIREMNSLNDVVVDHMHQPWRILLQLELNEIKGRMPTKIDLTLEQSQQGVSNDVLVSIEGVEELKKILSITEIKIDDKLYFVEEHVEIMDKEVKKIKRSWIPIVKIRWNSRQGAVSSCTSNRKFSSSSEHTTVETLQTMSPKNKAHYESEKEAIHFILTRIGDDIYLTVDACKTAQELWEAIERNAKKPKRFKDSTYHKEKMLLCKQAEQGVPLQEEHVDWLADMNDKIDIKELEAHYSLWQRFRKSNTCLVEKGDSDVSPDSPDMCEHDIQTDQNAKDERAALANLIANLKLDVDENKKIQKQLKKANTSLAYELE